MSVFQCKNLHFMKGRKCKVCDETVFYMDGMTNFEIESRENENKEQEDLNESNNRASN